MLEIITYPNTVLRKKADAVRNHDGAILKLLGEMADIMYQKDGVGLAAPQVGISKRIIVVDIGEGLMNLINPEIVPLTEEKRTAEEGCLSFPGIHVDISRPETVTVVGWNEKGEYIEKKTEGLWARVLQHEVDHLNGVLIIDHISTIQRALLKPKLRKLEKGSV